MMFILQDIIDHFNKDTRGFTVRERFVYDAVDMHVEINSPRLSVEAQALVNLIKRTPLRSEREEALKAFCKENDIQVMYDHNRGEYFFYKNCKA